MSDPDVAQWHRAVTSHSGSPSASTTRQTHSFELTRRLPPHRLSLNLFHSNESETFKAFKQNGQASSTLNEPNYWTKDKDAAIESKSNVQSEPAAAVAAAEYIAPANDPHPLSESGVSTAVTTDPSSSTDQPIEPEPSMPPGPPLEDEHVARPQRFSLLKFRNASDSQLSLRFKKIQHDEQTPPLPKPLPQQTPAIIRTSPTNNVLDESIKKKSVKQLFTARDRSPMRRNPLSRQSLFGHQFGKADGASSTPDLPQRPSTGKRQKTNPTGHPAPPPYGDESSSQLALPVERLSDSSRSDASSGEKVYAHTTTTHTISTTTTFFKLRRRKKDKGPLFPLPERLTSSSPRPSYSHAGQEGRVSMSPTRKSASGVRFEPQHQNTGSSSGSPTHSALALTNAPFGSPGPAIVRKDSAQSGHSTPSLIPPRLGARGRSSTMSSLGKPADRMAEQHYPQAASTRTSTSTTGRRSFGDLLSLPHRLRQNSTPPVKNGSNTSPGTPGSKSNSLQITREEEPEFVYPKREESDTPASYLERLEAAVPRGNMATVLCKGPDEFSKVCLRKYMRGFSYFGESVDMAIRKMLMEVELPKETQQIDRLLAGFADRYHECNPGIFNTADECTFVAFSILLLHSDTHNKNNKRKMTKPDYFKNTQQGPVQVSSDVLDCFYDNICYTPFIHFDDEVAINSHRLSAPKSKKGLIRVKSSEKLRGPVDPYLLILDNKLDVLRPPLKEVMYTDDHYKNTGSVASFEIDHLHKAFIRSGVLQIVSARSRPDAFMSQATIANPGEAQAGLVSIKVAKVGLLWRKNPKKKKAQSPWQEWGAILTDSKLYFFRDVGWAKKLISQHEMHAKLTSRKGPLIFKPPLTSFEPDALNSMDDAVALVDASYKRHKNAFTFIKHGGLEEVFLANTETEMNDWIGKLNYAATFRTAGIRMRGMLGNTYEGRQMLRKNSELSTMTTETPSKELNRTLPQSKDDQAVWEILFYRRQLMSEKISDLDEKIAAGQKELDNLLRNARHLLLLLPIQQKSRDAIIMSAGRMSAKLRWSRTELWRTRTYRDILAKDLDQETATNYPEPATSITAGTPQKTTPIKTSQLNLGRTDTDTSRQTMSPTTSGPSHSRRPSQPSLSPAVDLLQVGSTSLVNGSSESVEDALEVVESPAMSPSLVQQEAIVPPDVVERQISPNDDDEKLVLREAGLLGVDGNVNRKANKKDDKRPGTSDSDRDRLGAISPTSEHRDLLRDRGSSVRRSLHRTLRDSGSSHPSPSLNRHKKGKESGSSVLTEQDAKSITSKKSDELKRSTGSFILHGKKASVITMGSEWQNMTGEERLSFRRSKRADELKVIGGEDEADSASMKSGTVMSTDVLGEGKDFEARRSMAMTEDDDFVDAKTSLEKRRPDSNIFVDAKEDARESTDEEESDGSDAQESGSDDEPEGEEVGKAPSENGDDDNDNGDGVIDEDTTDLDVAHTRAVQHAPLDHIKD